MDNQEIDIVALQQELETLKASYADLEGKYNQLDNTHKEYKLNIEFQRDISDLYKPIGDEDKETLKDLKASGNDKAYNLLLNSLTMSYLVPKRLPRQSIHPPIRLPDAFILLKLSELLSSFLSPI